MVLRYGYNAGLPAGIATAWGCRATIDPDGRVTVVHDRQQTVGPRADALLDHLHHHVNGAWCDRAAELQRNSVMTPANAAELVLYQDSVVMIKGNTNGSHGYLYVCAYLVEGDEE